jgi:hypothetical protein
VGRSIWREHGCVVYNCCWPSPAQSFSGPSPVGLLTIFYCLRFQTSRFVASYDSQGYGGGIRPRLHTVYWLNWVWVLYYDGRSVVQSILESTTLGLTTRFLLLSDNCGLLMWGALSDDSWPSPAQSFSGPSPVGLATIFCCLRFEISLFVASYDYGGSIDSASTPCGKHRFSFL